MGNAENKTFDQTEQAILNRIHSAAECGLNNPADLAHALSVLASMPRPIAPAKPTCTIRADGSIFIGTATCGLL